MYILKYGKKNLINNVIRDTGLIDKTWNELSMCIKGPSFKFGQLIGYLV